MVSNGHDRNVVVVQLSGGNDCLNTLIPYEEGLYYDYRPNVHITPEQAIPLEDGLGLTPHAAPIKRLWDRGKVAIVNGVGYPNPNRSHFRSMDVWHTAEPTKIGSEGWLGQAIREIDPSGENVLTGVNFGRGLPRALSAKGVPVASVGDLETYGLFPDLQDEALRRYALDAFAKMYGATEGKDAVAQFLGQTGLDALKGADILRTAPAKYCSNGRICRQPDCPEPQERGPDDVRRSWHPRLLHPARELRHARRRAGSSRPALGRRFRAQSGTSTTISRSMDARTTRSSCSSPSSAGASRTTVRAPTTAPAAPPS